MVSPGLRLVAMSRTEPGRGSHRPATSMRPSVVFGAGAARSALPSAVRGMPAVGCFSHCADADAASTNTAAIAIRRVLTSILLGSPGPRRGRQRDYGAGRAVVKRDGVPEWHPGTASRAGISGGGILGFL